MINFLCKEFLGFVEEACTDNTETKVDFNSEALPVIEHQECLSKYRYSAIKAAANLGNVTL